MNNNLYHEKYDGSNEAEVFRHEVVMDLVFDKKQSEPCIRICRKSTCGLACMWVKCNYSEKAHAHCTDRKNQQ